MINLTLPDIGDVITFNTIWQLQIEMHNGAIGDNNFPCGVITSKKKYGELKAECAEESLTLFGTLAYPLSMGSSFIDEQIVFIVRWATSSSELAKSYKYINEEWFYNNSFLVVSKA